jgi:glucosyl-dolichyl phosphate glucuronosyltransferase
MSLKRSVNPCLALKTSVNALVMHWMTSTTREPTVPTFCMAVCTFGRTDTLLKTIERSGDELNAFDELVIIDNNADPSDVDNHLSKRWRIIHEPRTGLSHARNRALVESKSEYVWFIDDDASLRSNFSVSLTRFRSMLENMTVDEWPQYGGGLIIPYLLTNVDRPLGAVELGLLSCIPSEGAFDQPWGANMFVARSMALKVGGFGANFGYKGDSIARLGEEDDLFRRLDDESRRSNMVGQQRKPVAGAEVDHWIGGSRLTIKWQLKRALHGGQSNFAVYKALSLREIFLALPRLFLRPGRESLLRAAFTMGKLSEFLLPAR